MRIPRIQKDNDPLVFAAENPMIEKALGRQLLSEGVLFSWVSGCRTHRILRRILLLDTRVGGVVPLGCVDMCVKIGEDLLIGGNGLVVDGRIYVAEISEAKDTNGIVIFDCFKQR